MDIKVLGTGSKGNCYIINDGISSLLIECGIPFRNIQKGTGFNTCGLCGCIVSHSHKDHCLSADKLINRGVDVYVSADTKKEINSELDLKIVSEKRWFTVGSFNIYPFNLKHDVPNFGYCIYSKETKESLIYITDTYYVPQQFKNVDYIMVECNYVEKLILGSHNLQLSKRIINSHLSLESCIKFLERTDLTKVKKILLIHLSDERSDEELMLKEVMKATGKYVEVAKNEI